MISRIMGLLGVGESTEEGAESDAGDSGDRLKMATCVILVEAASVDDDFSEEERVHLVTVLRSRYDLSESEADELVTVASEERGGSRDLWQFTNAINRGSTNDEKVQIMEEVWHVICADDAIHSHEDHLAHKLAKLLNLTHKQMIDAKLRALDVARNRP